MNTMNTEETNLTENQKERIRNIQAIQMSVGLVGSIGGVIYAKKTGGGFWRYVGYWILGGLAAGIPAALVATPFTNKILKEGDKGTAGSGTSVKKMTIEEAQAIIKQIQALPKKTVTVGGKQVSIPDPEKLKELMSKLNAGGWILDATGKLVEGKSGFSGKMCPDGYEKKGRFCEKIETKKE